MKIFTAKYQSPIGTIKVEGTQTGIVTLDFAAQPPVVDDDPPACVQACVRQVDEYFKGERKVFSISLQMRGTDFQKSVWRQLLKVPYAKTASYSELAAAIGKPNAYRAVGNANGKNPISIIVPCHRIIGSDGTLTGYGGGLWRKAWLLNHEKQCG